MRGIAKAVLNAALVASVSSEKVTGHSVLSGFEILSEGHVLCAFWPLRRCLKNFVLVAGRIGVRRSVAERIIAWSP